MVSSIRCMHLTVVLKHKQRLGQEQEKLGRRRKHKKPGRAAGFTSMVGVCWSGFASILNCRELTRKKKSFPAPRSRRRGLISMCLQLN